jgi:hypothetical protein
MNVHAASMYDQRLERRFHAPPLGREKVAALVELIEHVSIRGSVTP